jgi:hypothetical protein
LTVTLWVATGLKFLLGSIGKLPVPCPIVS